MEKLNNLLSWASKMAKKVLATSHESDANLPLVLLLPSENLTVDLKRQSLEIKTYLTQILLLANKKGRPSKKLKEEFQDAT